MMQDTCTWNLAKPGILYEQNNLKANFLKIIQFLRAKFLYKLSYRQVIAFEACAW